MNSLTGLSTNNFQRIDIAEVFHSSSIIPCSPRQQSPETSHCNRTTSDTGFEEHNMDKKHQEYAKSLHVGHVRPDSIPWRRIGQCMSFYLSPQFGLNDQLTSEDLYRILEDGSQTQMRLCMIESLIPPRSNGPVFHFHEMHDEGFIITVAFIEIVFKLNLLTPVIERQDSLPHSGSSTYRCKSRRYHHCEESLSAR